MRRLFLTSLALIAFTFSAFAQVKHPFTFEDMMKLKRVGEPEVSPDGKWVIFSVVDVDLAANTKTPHIWIVPLTGVKEKWGAPCLAEFARHGNHGTRTHSGSGWRPPALGAGWEAVCVSLHERRRLAGLDCGV